ncbi:PadR family transcriptional regulator [Dactylosporangium sp. NPDC000244]|uniref:PadR family transcriptional regulator n=1 Tax=Dactylosporangium sp. NPDC000244 TaxID=3154365 RepID=UPI00332CCA45
MRSRHGMFDTGAWQRGFGSFIPPFPPEGGRGGGWGRGGHGHGGHGRGRSRGGRPNVRNAVLALLHERPMHGYEMIQELEQRTGGIWRPSPGSVYPTLQMLEDEGLIVAEESGGRKRFVLTDTGRPEAETAAQNAPWQEYGDENVSQAQEFRDAAFGIMDALRQVGFNGTSEQRAQALEVLTETRRKLYAILAD